MTDDDVRIMNKSWANELDRADVQYSWTRAVLLGKPRVQGKLNNNQTLTQQNG